MRPLTLDEVVGQEDIIGKGKLLYRAIKADRLSSIILYGPPGVGKTTLAKVIANTTSAAFHQINATMAENPYFEVKYGDPFIKDITRIIITQIIPSKDLQAPDNLLK